MKNKKPLIIYALILFISFFVQYYFFSNMKISTDFMANMIVFLSIVFGFYITSFAIFSTSYFVKSLYRVEDKEDSTQTLLHRLIKEYKKGLLFNFISIIYFIFLIFLTGQGNNNYLSLSNLYTYFTPIFTIMNFYFGIKMQNSLISIIIQESKINKI